ncbi:hypothetical protein [Afifella sp. H1R]|uniref:hypothetical protein n=1 Tax=Afifella sp. H1R TaxID=2908841 RepID=UPI001F3DBFF6|nr:hypothetical protein [Afifella sp. H1R]
MSSSASEGDTTSPTPAQQDPVYTCLSLDGAPRLAAHEGNSIGRDLRHEDTDIQRIAKVERREKRPSEFERNGDPPGIRNLTRTAFCRCRTAHHPIQGEPASDSSTDKEEAPIRQHILDTFNLQRHRSETAGVADSLAWHHIKKIEKVNKM